MTTKRFGKRLLKITGLIFGILIVLGIGFHFWFKAHARQLIEDMVESRSHGKLKLKMQKFSFNWFSRKMEFHDAVFYSTDSANANTSYRFRVKKINLEVQAILPIVFKESMIIDTLILHDPEIEVTRHKSSDKKLAREVSLPEEMGKVYNSIQDALKVLRVSRFLIDNGKFTLINKIQPDQHPITLGNLHFQIDNLQVDTTISGAREKLLFSDNVVLRSHDQDILLPDDRHRLSFSQFRINLQQKLVEFDSCTIAATRTDSSAASFTIFLDELKLIDIDFDTLYKHDVIKADSVYCVNPSFKLEVETGLKKGAAKSPPKLENIIKQLTGDLQLNHVIVSNADFNIKTIRDGVPNSFTFSDNNFEMQGLSIDQEAIKPLKVKSFVMAIRNYENFLKDSSYSVHFDSVLFRDDRISLSNFLFNKLDQHGRVINTFNIPQFYLGGLSWDDLVFERRLKADQATMFNPYISYTVSDKFRKKTGNSNIFLSLSAINDFMDLRYLDIMEGNLDLRVNENIRVQLEQATLAIQSHDLLTSTKFAGIKNSLTKLDFKRGIIHAGSLILNLNDINYLGETGAFSAGSIKVQDAKNNLAIDLNDVDVRKLQVNERNGDIYSDNISWQNGTINIKGAGTGQEMTSLLELRNVHGKNTKFTGQFGSITLNANFNNFSFDQLDKMPKEKLRIKTLHMDGTDLSSRSGGTAFSASEFSITDHSHSNFKKASWNTSNAKIDLSIRLPDLNAVPHIQALLDGSLQVDDVKASKPVIDLKIKATKDSGSHFPNLSINSIRLDRPHVNFSQQKNAGWWNFEWPGEGFPDFIELENLNLISSNNSPSAFLKKLKLNISDLSFSHPAGKKPDEENGSLSAELRDINLNRSSNNDWNWNATLTDLAAKDFHIDSLGKNQGRLEIYDASLHELGMNSESIVNLKKLSSANSSFFLKKFNGSYFNTKVQFNWFNAAISREKKQFTADSLSYGPSLEKEKFLAQQTYQKDYVRLTTGPVVIKDFNVEALIRDNAIEGSELDVNNAFLSDYRDNSLPFLKGIIKPLPVTLFRDIGIPLSLKKIYFHNSGVVYTQADKTKNISAEIPVTRMNLEIDNVKNSDFLPNDSLQIKASGYVFDSIRVDLQVKESYGDSLDGFSVKARFGSVNLPLLDPVLIPFASASIQSGFMDSATLNATGNDYLSSGEMMMYYRDLKIKLLKPGQTDPSKPGKGFLNFLANSFVIRNKNDHRTGVVFFQRDRERSSINYLVRIAMTGFGSSVGVKKFEREQKAYGRNNRKSK